MRAVLRLMRVTIVHWLLAALGAWATWAQLLYRTPNRYVTVVLASVAALCTGLTLAFWLYAMFRGAGATSRQLTPVTVAQKACALAVLGFTFYGLFLFSNGKFDEGRPVYHRTEIVRIGMDETEFGVRVPFVWADVRSWQRPGGIERILLRPEERRTLWGGQAVVVALRPGFYGVPWVWRLEPDREERSAAVLAMFPDAARVWQELAEFHGRLDRFGEAATTTREYTRRFPHDRHFPVHIAWMLTRRDRFADVITVLRDVAPRHQHPEVLMLLGYSLGMQGQQREGVPLLEQARAMVPRNWWPHYALGWVYTSTGEYARAIASFQKARELRPGLYDVDQQIERLRPLAGRAAGGVRSPDAR
jgi:tetratricopeptide (TPR) repeat protein